MLKCIKIRILKTPRGGIKAHRFVPIPYTAVVVLVARVGSKSDTFDIASFLVELSFSQQCSFACIYSIVGWHGGSSDLAAETTFYVKTNVAPLTTKSSLNNTRRRNMIVGVPSQFSNRDNCTSSLLFTLFPSPFSPAMDHFGTIKHGLAVLDRLSH